MKHIGLCFYTRYSGLSERHPSLYRGLRRLFQMLVYGNILVEMTSYEVDQIHRHGSIMEDFAGEMKSLEG